MKRPYAWATALLALSMTGLAPENFDPFPRKDEILKLFADEFVPLTPGQGKYPGRFRMGSKTNAAEQPVHEVTLGRPFAMAKYEVTQELYQVVMGKNPSKWKGPRNSVEVVSWREANDFCGRVTELLRAAKRINGSEKVRLPSEAEWEYACRAGTETAWSFGDDVADLTHYAWFKENSKGHDPPVGMKKANPWGFYDMHGYNWEWCADDWSDDYQDAPTDGRPRRVKGVTDKIIRGGAWPTAADTTRSAYRQHVAADRRDDTIGFRCVKATD